MKSSDIKAVLRTSFPPPEYTVLFEVADGTGASSRRWADAVAMSLWPSRGLTLEGFEIKISRQDWLREKANPEKAERIARYCDFWSVVTPPGLLNADEIPHNWGLAEVTFDAKGIGRFKRIRSPAKLDPIPVDRKFLAGLLRNAGRHDKDELDAAIADRMRVMEENFQERVKHLVDFRMRRLEEQSELYRQIDEAIGKEAIDRWIGSEDVIAAVRMVLASGVTKTWDGMRSLVDRLESATGDVRKALDAIHVPPIKTPEELGRPRSRKVG